MITSVHLYIPIIYSSNRVHSPMSSVQPNLSPLCLPSSGSFPSLYQFHYNFFPITYFHALNKLNQLKKCRTFTRLIFSCFLISYFNPLSSIFIKRFTLLLLILHNSEKYVITGTF